MPYAVQNFDDKRLKKLCAFNVYFVDVSPNYVIDDGGLNVLSTFTRASVGTTEIQQNVFTTAAVNEPRYKWVAGRRGFLIEPAATNLLKWSSDFSNSTWQKSAGIQSVSATVSQSSMGALWKLSVLSSGQPMVIQNVSVSPGPFKLSIVAGSAEINKIVVYLDDGGGNSVAYSINLTTGIASPTRTAGSAWSAASISVLQEGQNYKITLSATTSAALIGVRICPDSGSTYDVYGLPTAAGVSGNSVLSSGVQLESSSATSYIQTGSSVVTRAADVPTITATATGFNANEGTIICEYLPYGSDGLLASTDATLGKYIGLGVQGATTGGFATPSGGPDSITGAINKLSASHTSAGRFYSSRNGAAAVGITNCDYTGGATILNIGTRNRVTPLIIFNLVHYPRKFTAAELQAASTQG